MMGRLIPHTILGVVLASLLPARSAHADVTFVVNSVVDRIDDNTADGLCHTSANTCSLRAAIMQANHLDVPAIRIEVPAGIYTITIPRGGAAFDAEDTGDLNIEPLNDNQTLIISGAGAANTIIDGHQTERVFYVAQGAKATIARMTIRNGLTLSGAGISNYSTLTVTDSLIEGNQGFDGGGIYSSGPLNVVRSTIRSNTATKGGGLYLTGPSTLRGSTVYNNGAADGGGIYASSQPLYVVNSTLSANYANTNGGGIFSSGTTSFYNASVINNDADHDRDETGGIGGGVYVSLGTTVGISNTLIARNTILDAPIDDDCNGFLVAFGWNLFGETDGCAFGGNGAASVGLVSTATIGPLQDNGGPVWTHALLTGSQAIDSTFDAVGCYDQNLAPLSIDQRGARRPAGLRCDVGAFEYGAIFEIVFQDGFDG